MPLFTWNDFYSVNIAKIDDQHKNLIAIINELHDAMLQRRSKEVLHHVFEQLVVYTEEHFAYEEELLTRYEFPGYEDHKQAHEYLTAKVRELRKNYDQGMDIFSMKVMIFLKEWLAKHILGTDQLYKDFLNDEGVY